MFSNGIVNGICQLLTPFVGSNSQILSLVVLIVAAAFVLMWWLSEAKEGPVIWLLRFGVALGVLMNIFTLPPMLGLPGVCGA